MHSLSDPFKYSVVSLVCVCVSRYPICYPLTQTHIGVLGNVTEKQRKDDFAFLGEMSSVYLNVKRLFKQLQEQKSAEMANFPVNSVRQPRNTTPNIHVDNHNWNYSPQPCQPLHLPLPFLYKM